MLAQRVSPPKLPGTLGSFSLVTIDIRPARTDDTLNALYSEAVESGTANSVASPITWPASLEVPSASAADEPALNAKELVSLPVISCVAPAESWSEACTPIATHPIFGNHRWLWHCAEYTGTCKLYDTANQAQTPEDAVRHYLRRRERFLCQNCSHLSEAKHYAKLSVFSHAAFPYANGLLAVLSQPPDTIPAFPPSARRC